VIGVLIVDDQAMMRAGLRLMLEVEPDLEVVGEAGDGHAALEAARRTSPQVVLMDVRMPRMDGIEATRRLTAPSDPPRVLVLTTFDLDEYAYQALRAGASGFLLKDAGREQLVHAVRVIAAGESLLDSAITARLIERFVLRPPGMSDRLAALSARELEVMRLVARGLSNAEIAAQLVIGQATVKTHVTRILQKLTLRDRVQIVVAAYETGLVEAGR
jgi:DNA-binding NarL/FixJ family response regulator